MTIPRCGLRCVVVDSLQFSLKCWSSDQKVKTEKIFKEKIPKFNKERSKMQFPTLDSSALDLPILGQLPQEWLRKYRADRGLPVPVGEPMPGSNEPFFITIALTPNHR
jgi:hypothetical protein